MFASTKSGEFPVKSDIRNAILNIIFFAKCLENGQISMSQILIEVQKRSVLLNFSIFYHSINFSIAPQCFSGILVASGYTVMFPIMFKESFKLYCLSTFINTNVYFICAIKRILENRITFNILTNVEERSRLERN